MEFNVKDKSLHTFFGTEEKSVFTGKEISPYHLMKDEIIVPKAGKEFKAGDTVVFDLIDYAQDSRKELDSKYEYKVQDYDSISFKLVLKNHTVIDRKKKQESVA